MAFWNKKETKTTEELKAEVVTLAKQRHEQKERADTLKLRNQLRDEVSGKTARKERIDKLVKGLTGTPQKTIAQNRDGALIVDDNFFTPKPKKPTEHWHL